MAQVPAPHHLSQQSWLKNHAGTLASKRDSLKIGNASTYIRNGLNKPFNVLALVPAHYRQPRIVKQFYVPAPIRRLENKKGKLLHFPRVAVFSDIILRDI